MRITKKTLQPVVDRINRETGSPAEPWTKGEDGRLKANIGNYHLSSDHGGYALHRMANERGGVSDVLSTGHVPARELYGLMHAWLVGLASVRD